MNVSTDLIATKGFPKLLAKQMGCSMSRIPRPRNCFGAAARQYLLGAVTKVVLVVCFAGGTAQAKRTVQ